jgi:hypothetical protein
VAYYNLKLIYYYSYYDQSLYMILNINNYPLRHMRVYNIYTLKREYKHFIEMLYI